MFSFMTLRLSFWMKLGRMKSNCMFVQKMFEIRKCNTFDDIIFTKNTKMARSRNRGFPRRSRCQVPVGSFSSGDRYSSFNFVQVSIQMVASMHRTSYFCVCVFSQALKHTLSEASSNFEEQNMFSNVKEYKQKEK